METKIAKEMINKHGIEIALMITKSDYEQAKGRKDIGAQVWYSKLYQTINFIKYNK